MLDLLALHCLAFAYMRMGDLARAADYLNRTQINMRAINQEIFFRDTLDALRAEFYHRTGRTDDALAQLVIVKESATRNGGKIALAFALRVEAMMALESGDLSRAHTYAKESIAILTKVGALPDITRSQVVIAQIDQKLGNQAEAQKLFLRAEAIFDQLGAQYELENVRMLYRTHRE
jgi:ATP/maltotriose-dependent transcriptional regulator MalT